MHIWQDIQSRKGLTAEMNPPRSLLQPMEGGTLKGKKIDKEQFSKQIETYYEMMGWDPETGVPKRAKLSELTLTGCHNEIHRSRFLLRGSEVNLYS